LLFAFPAALTAAAAGGFAFAGVSDKPDYNKPYPAENKNRNNKR
jgi:hypothetical protein